MAPVVNQAPTALQIPPMSSVEKYKSYIRSNSNPSHQFDDNMKEPNNNKPDFKNSNINNNNNQSNIKNFNDDAPQIFTCYTSYSCTPTDIAAVRSNQEMSESSQKPVQANQGNIQPRFEPKNNHMNKVESGKAGSNAQFDNITATPFTPQTPEYEPLITFGHSSKTYQTSQSNILNNAECGKPALHAMLNNIGKAPTIPSPIITINDATPEQPPRQRKTSNPAVGERPQGPYGLAQSRSSPAISPKGSSPTHNESLVHQYFQNPQTYKNQQDKQLPGQGPVSKSMLPPPAPPAARSKSISPRNSFTEKKSSVPNASKSVDGKSDDWEKVLTKFYNW